MNQKIDTEDCENSCNYPISILLKKKAPDQTRKYSYEDFDDRPNFCCRYTFQQYTVMRVYINSIYSQSIKLYYTKFIPKVKKATICIIHGYGENSDQFLETADFYAKNNFVVNMVDLRGFGYSGGSRVNSSIKGTISDIQTLLRFCCQLNLPTYILAHGLGAVMLLALLQENPNLPISGVIISAPLLSFPNQNRGSFLHQIFLFLGTTFFDDLLINNFINPTALTKDPSQIQKRMIGAFNFQYVTLKMAHVYDELTEKVRKDGFKFVYPILICAGGKDFIQPLSQIRKFYLDISSSDKELKIFPQAYHEIHNDIQGEEQRHYILNWIRNSKGSLNRQSIKWTKTKPFNLQTLVKKSYFKQLILAIVLLIVCMYKLIKKYKKHYLKV